MSNLEAPSPADVIPSDATKWPQELLRAYSDAYFASPDDVPPPRFDPSHYPYPGSAQAWTAGVADRNMGRPHRYKPQATKLSRWVVVAQVSGALLLLATIFAALSVR